MAIFKDGMDFIVYPETFNECQIMYNKFIIDKKWLPMTKEDIVLTSGVHV